MDKQKEEEIKSVNTNLAESAFEKILSKQANLSKKEFDKHKFESIKISIVSGLFGWLIIGTILKSIILGAGLSLILALVLFLVLLQLPLLKRKKYALQIESELPLFLTKLASEIKLGKAFNYAILSAANEKNAVADEFKLVAKEISKGTSFEDALQKMNQRIGSQNIRRVCSNLSNLHGSGKKDITGIKKLAQELLLKQRIESKEFSGKMVVYALVFIAISAIVPAMFLSFTLIGSYFMKLSFTPFQIFLISVLLFPLLNSTVLFLINSKTPLFLRG